MMHNVRGPEETAFVADAMEPVVVELVPQKEQDPGPPRKADGEQRETMEIGQQRKLYGLGEQIDDDIADAHGQAGGGVVEFVDVALDERGGNGFGHQQSDE